MKIEIKKNIVIENAETRPFLADSFYNDLHEKMPLLIFVHGYKGYKDWGAWNLMAMEFARAGFYFVKFNFSHNGTTVEKPTEFEDLEAFGQNNFSKEISDIDAVINHFKQEKKVDPEKIALIGHSRGSGISLIKAYEDERIKAVVAMAGVSHFGYRFPSDDRLDKWKAEGVMYSENARTGQQMPHYFQFFEDYKKNEDRFNIQYAAQHLNRPFLIVQGSEDDTVKDKEAHLLHEWAKDSQLEMIDGANHTFGAKEPWDAAFLPEHLEEATNRIIAYLQENL